MPVLARPHDEQDSDVFAGVLQDVVRVGGTVRLVCQPTRAVRRPAARRPHLVVELRREDVAEERAGGHADHREDQRDHADDRRDQRVCRLHSPGGAGLRALPRRSLRGFDHVAHAAHRVDEGSRPASIFLRR
jgi:hypothetical protein